MQLKKPVKNIIKMTRTVYYPEFTDNIINLIKKMLDKSDNIYLSKLKNTC